MTSLWHEAQKASLANPIDLAEELLSEREWTYDRPERQELYAEFAGNWCNYRITLACHEAYGALCFSCALDSRFPAKTLERLHPLLAKINPQLWLGHFDICEESGAIEFRYAMLLKGVGGVSVEQLEDMLDIAITECERFYPAFQSLIWGGKNAHEVLDMVLMETQGEA